MSNVVSLADAKAKKKEQENKSKPKTKPGSRSEKIDKALKQNGSFTGSIYAELFKKKEPIPDKQPTKTETKLEDFDDGHFSG